MTLEEKRQMKEERNALRKKLAQLTADYLTPNEKTHEPAFFMMWAAALLTLEELKIIEEQIEQLGFSEAANTAKALVLAQPLHRPPLRPPPQGWAVMQGILETLRAEAMANLSVTGTTYTPLFLKATTLTHISPFYQALLARAIWDKYRSGNQGRILEMYELILSRFPALEKKYHLDVLSKVD